MEAIITDMKTGIRRVEDIEPMDFYSFRSTSEKVEWGHPTVFYDQTKQSLKDVFWNAVGTIPLGFPKTDLNISSEEIQKMALEKAKELLEIQLKKLNNKV